MSEISRPSVTEEDQFPSRPDYKPDGDRERPALNRRKLAALIGAGAAFATLVTGVAIGVNSKETHAVVEPSQQEPLPPIAPSTPEQNEPSPSISQSPSPEATPSQPEITKDNFVYSIEGSTFSYKDFIHAIEIPYEKNQDGGEVMQQFISKLNTMVRSGTAKNDRDSYDAYWSAESSTSGHLAVVKDFYEPAYKEALFTNSIEGHAVVSSGNLLDRVSNVHHETVTGYAKTRDEAQPYTSQYSISFDGPAQNATMMQRPDGGKDLSFFGTLTLTDNGDKNTYGAHREYFGSSYADSVKNIKESYQFNGMLYGNPEEGTWKLVEGNLREIHSDS